MEIILLVSIIIFLIFRLKTITDKLDNVNSNLNQLKESVRKLTLQETVKVEPKPVEKKIVLPKLEVREPVEEEKPIEREKVAEIKETPVSAANKVPERIQEIKPVKPFVPQKTWWERFRERNPDLEKFVGENLISKIGILILVLGISYFVKFAIDKDWINETARVGIGVLCGAILMGVAHRLRMNFKAFSSVLVAGAIAVLYFTIAIAFHQYHIFSQTVAFVLMVVITAFSVLISVSYDRMELAILSLIGGFAVPFMLSTGEGNYQVLFTYIVILDIGILAIAAVKRWSLVNILSFAFTALLFGGWLGSKVIGREEAPYFGAFIFATLFYIIFTFVNIINNLRTKGVFKVTELIILVVNTFLYFSAGMVILSYFHPEFKGIFTISLAVINLLCAWFLFKKFGLDKNAIYLFIGLTLTFVTLSVPLQFSGNYITLFWAAETVLLLWLSQKSQIVHFRFTSLVVQFLMISSLCMDWFNIYFINAHNASIFLNEGFVAGVFATLSIFAVVILTKKESGEFTLYKISFDITQYQNLMKLLCLLVLYLTGLFETMYQSSHLFKGFSSAESITVVYHLLFSSFLIFVIQKMQKSGYVKFALVLAMANIFMYILFFSTIPLDELRYNLRSLTNEKIAYYMHFIALVCIIYQGISVRKDIVSKDALKLKNQKWFVWLAALTVVFIASSEVYLQGTFVLANPRNVENESFRLAYETYHKAQIFVIKVAFPILWGLLAILFLTIGIKKQMRDLRIVALSLLGLTILKLFVYDISNASETGKIIAFILLGIMILVMSFAYQKIKKIVLENEKSEDDEIEEK